MKTNYFLILSFILFILSACDNGSSVKEIKIENSDTTQKTTEINNSDLGIWHYSVLTLVKSDVTAKYTEIIFKDEKNKEITFEKVSEEVNLEELYMQGSGGNYLVTYFSETDSTQTPAKLIYVLNQAANIGNETEEIKTTKTVITEFEKSIAQFSNQISSLGQEIDPKQFAVLPIQKLVNIDTNLFTVYIDSIKEAEEPCSGATECHKRIFYKNNTVLHSKGLSNATYFVQKFELANKIKTGMTKKEITGTYGTPCFESQNLAVYAIDSYNEYSKNVPAFYLYFDDKGILIAALLQTSLIC